LFTFVSLVLLRTHKDLAALILILGTWTIVPILILTDRLNFDGHALSRTGLGALLIRIVRQQAQSIAADDIERVDVATLRTLRRGGNVRYRYRVEIAGRGLSFIFTSGRKEFRQMVRTLLPRVPDHKLDARAR